MGVLDYVLLFSVGLIFLVGSCIAFYVINMRHFNKKLKEQQEEAEKKFIQARLSADEMLRNALREAKDIALNENKEFEQLQKEKNIELQKIEKRVQKREEMLDKKAQQLDQKEKELNDKFEKAKQEETKLQEAIAKADQNIQESALKLEAISGLTVEEAREQLKKTIESDVRKVASAEIKLIEEEARKTGDERAKSILAVAIQRLANEFVTDATVSVINLPNDDMKGRIIGREGRNIRAIEQATGVDLIIDDTPEAILISCFNPIRREIAKTAIERLVLDGRIHPARIEEVVQKVTEEFEEQVKETGERSAFESGITGLHPDIIQALGKLKYFTTGGQSVLQHAIETAEIAGIIAAELELNVRLAKRAGLLHDIGKSLPQEVEGSHGAVGAQFLQKYNEPQEVVEAALKHHTDNIHGVSPICVVVQAANMLSNFRPGARREFLERAIGRLSEMEKKVEEFQGVEQAYVIKSGREVRAIVAPTVLDDEAVTILAKSVARKLRQEINFPGQIKVTMVREQRVTHLAR